MKTTYLHHAMRLEPLEARIAPAFVTGTFSLAAGAAGAKTKFVGVAAGDNLGSSVSDVGDVNGDGYDDFLIGAPNASHNARTNAGSAYVIFGGAFGLPATFDFSTLDGTNGLRIDGEAAGDRLGTSVSGAGDFNGDGLADMVLGAPRATVGTHAQAGTAYIFYGRAGGYSAGTFDLFTLTDATGARIIEQSSGDQLGSTVSGLGDVNGDHLSDLLIAAPGNNGAAYIVYGNANYAGTDVSALSAADSVRIPTDAAGNGFAKAVTRLGDMNGDGLADFAIGAPNSSANTGAVFVVFGSKTFPATFLVSSLNGDNGFKLLGGQAGDLAGTAAGAADDLNGDGFADLLVGAPGVGGSTGRGYVVFGKPHTFTNPLNLEALTGTNGFAITGEASGDTFGASVHGAGDVNGDGLADIIIGAPNAGASNSLTGASYVIFGKLGTAPFGSSLALSTLQGPTGFKIQGETAGDIAGQVSAAGDVNGDGYGDLLIGAPQQSGANGQAYLVYGGPSGVFIDPTFSNGGKTATYTDVDGDLVTVTVSKGTLDATNFSLLAKTPGHAEAQLLSLNLGTAAGSTSEFDAANVSITAKTPHGGTGNGKVNVGLLNASNTDLGAVTIGGDLGGVFAGDSADDPGLKSLTIGSLFGFGGRTSDPVIGFQAGVTVIAGPAGPIKIAGDCHGFLSLQQAATAGKANLTSFSVGSSLLGGIHSNEGSLQVDGSIGPVTIGRDLRAGSADFTGSINATTSIGAVRIGGSLEGGPHTSGFVQAGGNIASVTVGRDVLGGAGFDSGDLLADSFGAVKIGGSLEGNTGVQSGFINSNHAITSLTIGGDLRGGSGTESGTVFAGTVGALKIGGSLEGGAGPISGVVSALSLTSLTIGHDLRGGTANNSGVISINTTVGAVKIGGSLLGNTGGNSGRLEAGASFGPVRIGGSLTGDSGDGSGDLQAGTTLTSVSLGGSLRGGSGGSSGQIGAAGDIGRITIGHDQIGGLGGSSGLIFGRGSIASVTLGGSGLTGDADFSGGILASGTLGPVSIGGDVRGTAEHPYFIRGGGPLNGIRSVAIASVQVGGDFEYAQVLAGFGVFNAPVNGHAQIGAITVGGDWMASSVNAGVQADHQTFINAGPSGVVASIASITIKGRVLGTFEPDDHFSILAEQIGAITIAGHRVALTAGKANDLTPIQLGETPDFFATEILRA